MSDQYPIRVKLAEIDCASIELPPYTNGNLEVTTRIRFLFVSDFIAERLFLWCLRIIHNLKAQLQQLVCCNFRWGVQERRIPAVTHWKSDTMTQSFLICKYLDKT